MKRIHAYLPSVLLTFLLTFALLGTELLCFVQTAVLSPATYRKITEQEQLGEKAYASLEAAFTARSHSTGIPAEVFLEGITPALMEEAVKASFTAGLESLHGGQYNFTMELPEMEASVRSYIANYAEENGIAQDAAYDEKVETVLAEARERVLSTADTFKFGTLHSNGWLETGSRYLKYLTPATLGCGGLALVLLVLLAVLNRKQVAHMAYWSGLSALIAGLLLLVPMLWLTVQDYYTAFAIKDPQIYAAVVGLLRSLTSAACTMAAVTAGAGVVLLLVFGLAQRNARND